MGDKDNPWFDQEPTAEEREWDERFFKMNEDATEDIAELRGKYLGETIDIETYLTQIVAAYLVDKDKELYERLMENIFWHRSISFFTKIDFAENLFKQDDDFWISRDTIKLLRQTGERRNVLAHQNFSVDLFNLDEGPSIKPTTAKGLPGDKTHILDQELTLRWIGEAKDLKQKMYKILGPIELDWIDEQYPEDIEDANIQKISKMPENKDHIDLEGWDLHHAAKANSLDVARLLIEHGAEVDAKDKGGWTPLHVAAGKNSLEIARLLLEHGAEVDVRDKRGWTPLYFAAYLNSLEVAGLLLENGADVDARTKDDGTPLSGAAWKNSLSLARLFIKHGADVNAKDKDGWAALHGAAFNNSLEVARLLIEKGAEVDARNKRGDTPLHQAAWKNSLDVARLLIAYGTEIDVREGEEWTPLHHAVWKNSLDVARMLIDRGAEIDAKTEDGNTPLWWAAQLNYPEVARLLIEHGANTDGIDLS